MLIENRGRVQYKELMVYMSEITFQKSIQIFHSLCVVIPSVVGLKTMKINHSSNEYYEFALPFGIT